MSRNQTWDIHHSYDDAYVSGLLGEEGTFQNDAEYSEALQLHEALMRSLVISEEQGSFDDEAKFGADSDAGESSMSFCEICMERAEKEDMFNGLSCAHMYCTDCVTKHVFSKLQENVANVGCPAPGCNAMLNLEVCRPMLPNWLIDDWSGLMCRDMIDDGDMYYCPYKDCSGMMFADEVSGIEEAECPFCRRLFCARCSVPWHDGLKCEEYQKLGKDEKGREDVMLMRLAKDEKWSRCPKCKFYVERSDGCAHMVCRCKYEFCYGCGQKWTNKHSGCAKD